MDHPANRLSLLEDIDRETLSWLLEFSTWKRRKCASPEEVDTRFVLEYMSVRLYDYYFIQRNYTRLVPLLESYQSDFGPVQGLTQLIEDLKLKLSPT